MCGITGFISDQPVFRKSILVRMCNALQHRGPDSQGVQCWDHQCRMVDDDAVSQAGLAQCRLSIIDTSDAGLQPMANEDASVWISYNGEFYNYGDYQKDLEAKGHVFKSRCDTESIIHSYESYGLEETLRRINGMFAFALLDQKENKLMLARDRIGQKPLYYALLPGNTLIFASEIKAILESGEIDTELIDYTALNQFWTFGYIMGSRTIYQQIKKIPAGCYGVWKQGVFNVRQYWDCPFGQHINVSSSLDELTDELEVLIEDSIRLRLRSDVPLGLFLSGGLDSTCMTAILADKIGVDFSTYTIAFDQKCYNEAHYARKIAEYLGLENRQIEVNKALSDSFEKIVRNFDEPFGDSSAIPMWFLAKHAREFVTVALSGDGGDELFAGYHWHKVANSLWGCNKKQFICSSGASLRERAWLERVRFKGLVRGSSCLEQILSSKQRQCLFSKETLRKCSEEDACREREAWFENVQQSEPLAQLQYVNFKTYLVDDVLVKVDRCSMAHALECRSPFLDYRIVEFAARLPGSAKYDSYGKGKYILRKLLARYMPSDMYERPKQGFTIPWEQLSEGTIQAYINRHWSKIPQSLLLKNAAESVFSLKKMRSPYLQWNMFSMFLFMQNHPHKYDALD